MEPGGAAAADSDGWTLGTDSLTSVLANEGASSAALLNDGRIALVDESLCQLEIFAPSGSRVASYGREGYGPGEFQQPSAVIRYRGDSVAVMDVGLRRVLVFSPEHGFARDIPLTIPAQRLDLIGALADGAFILRAWNFELRNVNAWTQPATVVRVNASGGRADTLFTVPGEQFYRLQFAGSPVFGVRPFGRRSVVTASGDLVVVNDGSTCDLVLRNGTGTLTAILRPLCLFRPVTERAKSDWAAARIAEISNTRSANGTFAVSFYRSGRVPYGLTTPAYDQLLLDDCGILWLGMYSLPRDSLKEWSLFARDGHRLGTAVTPYPLRVQQITAHSILGIRADSLGEGRVTMYRLLRPGAPMSERPCRSD